MLWDQFGDLNLKKVARRHEIHKYREEFSPGFSIFNGNKTSINMISATDIRNKVIDQWMAIKDADYLRALSDMIDRSHVQQEVVPLTRSRRLCWR